MINVVWDSFSLFTNQEHNLYEYFRTKFTTMSWSNAPAFRLLILSFSLVALKEKVWNKIYGSQSRQLVLLGFSILKKMVLNFIIYTINKMSGPMMGCSIPLKVPI